MRELEIVPRLPYSASANPDLFLWRHVIRVLNAKLLSRSARFVNCDASETILVIAVHIAYHLGVGMKLAEQAFTDVAKYEQVWKQEVYSRCQEDGTPNYLETTRSRISNDIMNNCGEISVKIKQHFAGIKSLLQDARPNTVGRFLRSYPINHISHKAVNPSAQ